jgi:hypothetical protein
LVAVPPQVEEKSRDKNWALPYTFAGEKTIWANCEDFISKSRIGIPFGRRKRPASRRASFLSLFITL